ncbi:MAG TPA: hypothetical protein VK850_08675 [Candidatus Binatia bacterium]|nr:hypothetical protein [Candidatus Binatia bacterium]
MDLLADNVMENVEHIQSLLRERKSLAESESVFGAQEASLQERLQAVLGPEGLAQYNDYTHNLLSYLTAEQFKGVPLSGQYWAFVTA